MIFQCRYCEDHIHCCITVVIHSHPMNSEMLSILFSASQVRESNKYFLSSCNQPSKVFSELKQQSSRYNVRIEYLSPQSCRNQSFRLLKQSILVND